MRLKNVIVFLFFLPFFSLAQKDSHPFIINEYGITMNYFYLNQDYAYGKTGYGAFAFHSGDKNKLINLVYGVEFNHVGFHLNNIYAGHYENYSNANITCNTISFPLLIRVGIGSKIRFFVETGVRADFRLWSNMQALYETSFPNSINQQVFLTTDIDKSASIAGNHPLDFIPSFGIGVSYKINKISLNLKTDYRMGLSDFYNNEPIGDLIYNRYFNLSFSIRINNQK